jgi:hypothetical protein
MSCSHFLIFYFRNTATEDIKSCASVWNLFGTTNSLEPNSEVVVRNPATFQCRIAQKPLLLLVEVASFRIPLISDR